MWLLHFSTTDKTAYSPVAELEHSTSWGGRGVDDFEGVANENSRVFQILFQMKRVKNTYLKPSLLLMNIKTAFLLFYFFSCEAVTNVMQ